MRQNVHTLKTDEIKQVLQRPLHNTETIPADASVGFLARRQYDKRVPELKRLARSSIAALHK